MSKKVLNVILVLVCWIMANATLVYGTVFGGLLIILWVFGTIVSRLICVAIIIADIILLLSCIKSVIKD